MKSVFITGAGAGIGLATARLFAERGWFVGLYDVNAEAVQAQLQSAAFPNACGGFCDVTDRDSIQAALDDFADKAGGRLDVLVNNAGVLWSGPAEDIASAHTHAMIDINIRGLTDVAYLAFPLLRDTPDSCLVNLCSLSSVYGVPNLAVYSASKFYVRGLTEALNLEWEKHGIHVTSIKPPYIQTAMLNNIEEHMMETMKPAFGPEDVARVIIQATQGRRVSYFMGWTGRLMSLAIRLLPESLSRHLMRRLISD